MAYGNVSFTMATPFFGRIAYRVFQPVMKLAKDNREFAALNRIPSLHFAAFGLVKKLRDAGGKNHRLDNPNLLFFSLFDGTATAYLSDFSVLLPDYIDSIWSKCVRYPGARSQERFIHWLNKHSISNDPVKHGGATSYEYHGYRVDSESASSTDAAPPAPSDRRLAPMALVLRALELRRRLHELRRRDEIDPGSVTVDDVQSLAVEAL